MCRSDFGGKMRTSLVRLFVPLAILAAACDGGDSQSASLSADLKQDLAAASAPKLELASAAGDYQPMRFVSELEQTNLSTPVKRAPTPRPEPTPAPKPVDEPTPEPQPEAQVAEAPQVDEAVSAVPSVAPRPSALPVDVPSTQGVGNSDGQVFGRGGDRGADIGGIIGVVIRGGGVGPDHCPPRRRGGRRPFPILP